MRNAPLFAAVVAALVLAFEAVQAQAPVPVGGEFRVHVVTAEEQFAADVGVDADGDFVVVWASAGTDGSGFGIFARRYTSAGVAQGGQFQLNSYTVSTQFFPAVAVDADGDFVAAWESYGQDGNYEGVFARRFNSAGTALTAELAVNLTTAGAQMRPDVATSSNGSFVVVWDSGSQDGSSNGVFRRRFNSSGSPLGGELQVNTYTIGAQTDIAIAMAASGDFVVTWRDFDGSSNGIFGQRFSAASAPQGPDFQVNVTFTNQQSAAAVGLDADGDFVVVWVNQDGSSFEIVGRRFNSAGTPLGSEFPVNDNHTPSNRTQPAIALDADGDFVVTWRDSGGNLDGSGEGVFMRRFKSSGLPQQSDTQVNTTTAGNQYGAAVAADPEGDFVVAWTSVSATITDVFAQRFDVPPLLDVDGNGVFDPLTDGLLVLRFGFGFTGSTLITGAVGGGCTRCNASSITAYLKSMV
jgi:hypothetical protein